MDQRKLVGVSLFAVIVALMAVGSVWAFNPQPDPPSAIPVGLADTQLAEVHVVFPPVNESDLPPDPVLVGFGIYDGTGMLLARMRESVESGQVKSLRLTGRSLGLPPGGRRTIYGVVQCLGDITQKVRCAKSVNASMEISDVANGKTMVAVPVGVSILPIISRDGMTLDR
jgi:hypothetical protein